MTDNGVTCVARLARMITWPAGTLATDLIANNAQSMPRSCIFCYMTDRITASSELAHCRRWWANLNWIFCRPVKQQVAFQSKEDRRPPVNRTHALFWSCDFDLDPMTSIYAFELYIPKLFPTGLITRTLGPSNDFTLLNGWICLHSATLTKTTPSRFSNTLLSLHFHFISFQLYLHI